MNIQIPWFYIAVFVSLSLFMYLNQKAKIKKEARRNRMQEKQEELVEMLKRIKEKEEENNKTEKE